MYTISAIYEPRSQLPAPRNLSRHTLFLVSGLQTKRRLHPSHPTLRQTGTGYAWRLGLLHLKFFTQHWLTPEVGAWDPELPLGQAGPTNLAPGQWRPKVGKNGAYDSELWGRAAENIVYKCHAGADTQVAESLASGMKQWPWETKVQQASL